MALPLFEYQEARDRHVETDVSPFRLILPSKARD